MDEEKPTYSVSRSKELYIYFSKPAEESFMDERLQKIYDEFKHRCIVEEDGNFTASNPARTGRKLLVLHCESKAEVFESDS